MKQAFLILSTIIVMLSCSKSDTSTIPQSLQGRFQTGHTLTVSFPVMYVQGLQITDTAIINTYLRAHNLIHHFIYTPTQAIVDTLLTIEFGNNDSVNVSAKGSPFYKAKSIAFPDDVLLIKRFDSTIFYVSYPPVPTLKRCDTLGSLIQKSFPTFYYNVLPGGGFAHYIVFGSFPLVYQNGQLSLKLKTHAMNTSWNYPGGSNGNCDAYGVDVWGIRPPGILQNNLVLHDTIVIQEKSVPLSSIP